MIRISIVEDNRGTREGYIKLLRHAPGIVCLASYENAEQAEKAIPQLLPDVVIMDINLPGRSGIECVGRLKRLHPQLEFLMLTTHDDSDMIFESLRVGASGYLLKYASPAELIQAIEQVSRGGSPMTMEVARKVVTHFQERSKPASGIEDLTAREYEILALLSKGLAYKQMADRLDISPRTVQNHLNTIYKKLHVQSRAEAAIKFTGQ
jgi:DNA-binding NarL/FixJ family response regulator